MTSALHKIVENAPDLAPSTRNKYLRDLNAWIEFAGDNPRGWTQPRAEEFYAMLLKDRKLRPQSANRLMASISYAAKWWSVSQRKPELDFVQIRTMSARNRIEKRTLDQAQAMLILSACDQSPHGLRDFALIVIGLETGMRRMSLSAMMFQNLTDDPGMIRVPTKGSNGELRDIILTPTALRALRPWREWLGNPTRGYVFCPLKPHVVGVKREWKSTKGTPLSGSTIQKLVTKRSEDSGAGHVHPHMFRHTFTTWRMNAGNAPHEVASVTGHTLPEFGAMARYIDHKTVAETMRNSTPGWLFDLVVRRIP